MDIIQSAMLFLDSREKLSTDRRTLVQMQDHIKYQTGFKVELDTLKLQTKNYRNAKEGRGVRCDEKT